VSLPDLDIIALPDLTGADYPDADHEPTCVDTIIDAKPCWPAGLTALYRVRPYAHPTEDLGRIRFPWMRIRSLFPVPPSIGVHCGTVVSTQTDVNVAPPGAGVPAWERDVEQPSDDACRVDIKDILTIPCILPSFASGSVTMVGNPVGTTSPVVTGLGTCNQTVRINVALQDLSGGTVELDAKVVGFTFEVGTTREVDWATAHACIDGTSGICVYAPGDDIPILVDVDGFFGTVDGQVGSGAAGNITVANGDTTPIFCGDIVKISKVVDGGSGADTWLAFKR
jgi:hypothetical protein